MRVRARVRVGVRVTPPTHSRCPCPMPHVPCLLLILDRYYIDSAGQIYYYPSTPLSEWSELPSVSVNMTAVALDGVSHVALQNVTIAHSRGERAIVLLRVVPLHS